MTATAVPINAKRPQRATAAGVGYDSRRSNHLNPIMETLEKQCRQPVLLLPAPRFQCLHCQDTGLEYSPRWDGSYQAYPCRHCQAGQRMEQAEQAAIWHDTMLAPAERAGRTPATPPPTVKATEAENHPISAIPPIDEADDQAALWSSLSSAARAVLITIAHPAQSQARWIPVEGASPTALQELDDELLIAYVKPIAEARLTPKGRHLVDAFLAEGRAS